MDSINHPIELRVILKGSQTVTSCSCFPSPQQLVNGVIVLLTPTKMMILVVHCTGLWFNPSIQVQIVFLCIPFHGVRDLHLSLPMTVHVCFYWLSCLITFQAPHWAPTFCHASIKSILLLNSLPSTHLLTLHPQLTF